VIRSAIRHCEERSDEAIQNGDSDLDCFVALRAPRNDAAERRPIVPSPLVGEGQGGGWLRAQTPTAGTGRAAAPGLP